MPIVSTTEINLKLAVGVFEAIWDDATDLLTEYFETKSKETIDVLKTAWFPVVFLPKFALHMLNLMVDFETLLQNLINLPSQSLQKYILERILEAIPSDWSHRVVRRDVAAKQFFASMYQNAQDFTNLQLPVAFRAATFVKKVQSLAKLFDGLPKVPKLIGKFFFKGVTLVLNLLLSGLKFFGSLVVVGVGLSMLYELLDGKLFIPLSQSAPRKTVKSEEGRIRRREPGGSKP